MTRPYLGNPKYTIEVLQKYNFAFQKRFGQNFLIDTHVLEKIILISAFLYALREILVHRFRNNYTTHLSANPIAQA